MNKSINIGSIIKERLKLQSTQKALENEFSLRNPSYERVTSSVLKDTIKSWDKRKQRKFIQLVGGCAYVKETGNFLGL